MSNVYKYLGCGRLGFLLDGLIRFTPPAALNDPYECLAAFPDVDPVFSFEKLKQRIVETIGILDTDTDVEKVRKQKRIDKGFEELERRFAENPWFFRDMTFEINNKKINNGLGILSLSRRWDSALMWSHYTATYSGFCVGFDKTHPFFEGVKRKEGMRSALYDVLYSSKRTIIPERVTDVSDYEIFLTKSLDWKYEEEERILANLEIADAKKDAEPYPIHLFEVPMGAISELVIGHNASAEVRDAVTSAARKLGVNVYETCISMTSFDVERRLLKAPDQ